MSAIGLAQCMTPGCLNIATVYSGTDEVFCHRHKGLRGNGFFICTKCGKNSDLSPIYAMRGYGKVCFRCHKEASTPEQEKQEPFFIGGVPALTDEQVSELVEAIEKNPGMFPTADQVRGILGPPESTSQTILSQAQEIIAGRHERYGDCTEVFAATNEMFAIYRGLKKGETSAHDTAVFNIIQKLVRIGSGQNHQDNWIDIAGYAATGGEVSE